MAEYGSSDETSEAMGEAPSGKRAILVMLPVS
jgi:hypothetical protein